jgi:hypothetical protein
MALLRELGVTRRLPAAPKILVHELVQWLAVFLIAKAYANRCSAYAWPCVAEVWREPMRLERGELR